MGRAGFSSAAVAAVFLLFVGSGCGSWNRHPHHQPTSDPPYLGPGSTLLPPPDGGTDSCCSSPGGPGTADGGSAITPADAGTAPVPLEGSWRDGRSMNEARAGAISVPFSQGWILVAGGEDSSFHAQTSAELLDLYHFRWRSTDDMHHARTEAAATLLSNGEVLVTGGAISCDSCSGGWSGLTSAEVYDPHHGHWSNVASMHHARYGHQALRLGDGRVLVGAGSSDAVEIYDPRSDRWSAVTPAPHDLTGGALALLADGQVLGVAVSPSGPTHAEIYDPKSDSWQAGPSMDESFVDPTAIVLHSGRVLVTDGPTSGPTAAALFDPVQNAWLPLDAPPLPRNGGAATLLSDGRVLIVGGTSSAGDVAQATLFDEQTGTWSLTPPLDPAPGIEPIVQPLSGGWALVAGGGSNPDGVSPAVRLFQP